MSLGHAVSHFYQLAFAPLFPYWRDQFDLNWTQLGLIMTLFYTVSCLAQASAGFLVDRHGPRRTLIAGFVLMSAGTMVAATATSYAGLLAAAVVVALGNSVFHPADFALLNHKVSERRMGHAFSMHGLSGTLGYAAAPVLMVWLAVLVGWRDALWIAAAAGAALALVVALLGADFSFATGATQRPAVADRAAADRDAPVAGPIFAFFNPALAACMLFFVTVNIAGIGVQNMGASLLEGIGRMDAATAAGWITAYIGSVAAGMVAGGFVAGSGLRHEGIAAGGTLTAASLLLLLLHPAVTPLLTGLLLCGAGFALGVVTPARDLLVRSAAPKAATGRAYGIVYSAVDIGAALGPALMGWWLDRRMPAAGFASAAVFLVATAFAGWLISAQVKRLRAVS